MNNIQLAHGSGGQAMQQLINSLFMEAFANPWLAEQEDQARLDLAQLVAEGDRLAFSTDSYVIDPLFFPGGNIGKLAICGTANDVAVSGAIPRYLSCGFILEEGLPMETLKAVVTSMAETARAAGIAIVTGDTKVVQRGAADKLFINTAGSRILLVYNKEELQTVCARGLQASIIHQVLVEESILGWEELELEVVRDKDNNMITVCFIENVDPVGVHTGDSFCTAPMLTISEDLQKELQRQAYKIVEHIGVIGGTNVQFAHDPVSGRVIVIEINPRTSRSSALASKATGFPIALVSAKLATGLTLSELPDSKFGTLDKYVPNGDYVVVKFARWAFEKFRGVEDKLGTQMRAVGEVMSIGKNFKEAFQKAIRSLEKDRYGLGCIEKFEKMSREELLRLLKDASSERYFLIYEAIKKGVTVEEIFNITKVKHYFLNEIKELVEEEKALLTESKGSVPAKEALIKAKKDGFSDKYLSKLLGVSEDDIRNTRMGFGLNEAWDGVHVYGTDGSAYYYSTYQDESALEHPMKLSTGENKKIMILGGGPNRIGQGIEFDYCCVHAAMALKKLGFETIIVNCNPETVSTDYDTSDKLYFEPLTLEDVLQIYRKEQPLGVIAQFGGQTPLNLAAKLKEEGVNILGTTPEVIDLAEDRDQFRMMMEKLGIPMAEAGMASDVEEAKEIAARIGYPVMVRPSFVLGGRGMEIVRSKEQMEEYMRAAVGVTPDRPILIDRFLHNALECEADAISDGEHAFVPAVMEE